GKGASSCRGDPLAFARFLLRRGLVRAGNRWGREVRFGVAAEVELAAGAGQDRWPRRRFSEAEGGRQIAEGLAPPIRYVRLAHAREPLEEPQDRSVVERLAAHPAAGGPWRNHDAGNAEAAADGHSVDE